MIILDFLFKICLAPISKFEEKGKLVAVIWLTPILSFVLLAALNVGICLMKPIIDLSFIAENSFVVAIAVALVVIFVLQKIYLMNKRVLGSNFSPMVGLLIPILLVGSLVLFVMSFRYT